MSKQKYYVKLKEEFQATGVTFADMSLYLNENGDFDLKYFAHPFTKSEIELVSDGVIYKRKWRNLRNDIDFGEGWEMKTDNEKSKSYWEWINPLIKFVPVEVEV